MDENKIERRKAASFYLRSGLIKSFYLLGEIDFLRTDFLESKLDAVDDYIVFGRMGHFFREYIDIYVQSGYHYNKNNSEKNFRLGSKIRLFSGLELEFYFDREKYKSSSKRDYFALQVHLFY